MDIRSKKSSKTAKLIIALAVLLPALILVCLYPRMEEVMRSERAEYEQSQRENVGNQEQKPQEATDKVTSEKTEQGSFAVTDSFSMNSVRNDFVNYVMESSYYLYGKLLQTAEEREINFEVLDTYGWINDFYTLEKETVYWVMYQDIKGTMYEDGNADQRLQLDYLLTAEDTVVKEQYLTKLRTEGIRGYLILGFDRYGKIEEVSFTNLTDLEYDSNLYREARKSVERYQSNAKYYTNPDGRTGEAYDEALAQVMEVVPKNFQAVFALKEGSSFINEYSDILNNVYEDWYYSDPVNMYLEMGALFVEIAMAAVVGIIALILPFFKKLNTGWEKLFCMPFELTVCLTGAGFLGAYFMFGIMCHSTFGEIEQSWGHAELLGYPIDDQTVYVIVLMLNFLCWAVLYFAEYIVVSGFRQFLCGPVAYLKYRLLGIVFLRWIGRQCKRIWHYMTDIDISKNLHSSIVKIVLLNGILVTAMCCGWFFGVIGTIFYSAALYVILRKRGKQLQEQYNSVLHAAGQMAEGELKIRLKEDLGMFAPLGRALEQVQEGFSKAVAEEAKSQNMKTELISNVSHDLKTPLTAIITYVNLLKQPGNTPEQQQNYIQTLDMKSQRLKALIEDLFEVSKAQSGNIQVDFMDVDVVNLMKQVRLEMEDKIADSDLVFRWNLPEEKVVLSLDGQKTYRIFENLLINALKYAMPSSRVYVDILSKEEEVQIIFKNISATELHTDGDRLTERFVRGDDSRNSEGSGLGLAIVKSFTELQNGTFKIDIDGDLFKAILIWKK